MSPSPQGKGWEEREGGREGREEGEREGRGEGDSGFADHYHAPGIPWF